MITEVKRKLGGGEERFETELIHRSPSLLLVLYRIERGADSLDSYGCFWPRRPYGCYHIVRPPGTPDAGREVLSRFDVLTDLEIVGDEVRYLDLLLDLLVRVGPAGRPEHPLGGRGRGGGSPRRRAPRCGGRRVHRARTPHAGAPSPPRGRRDPRAAAAAGQDRVGTEVRRRGRRAR